MIYRSRLQAPGKERTYEVLIQTEKETTYPNGRFLLKTPKGQGGYCLGFYGRVVVGSS